MTTNTHSTPSNLSPDDLSVLERAPLVIFLLVAGADKRIDKKEIDEFIHTLVFPQEYYSELLLQVIDRLLPLPAQEIDKSDKVHLRQIVQSVANHLSQIIHLDLKQRLALLIEVKRVLDSLPQEVSQAFKLSLFHIGHRLAASSGGFFSFGNKVSRQEKAVLKKIVHILGIEIKDMN